MIRKAAACAVSAAIALACAARCFAQENLPEAKKNIDKLVAVIKSPDAGQMEKHEALRQLAIFGGRNEIPAIAPLLLDEKLSHMARYALEPMPDPMVDEVLRDALAKAKGKPLVGIIGSIGARKDAGSVDALAKFLADADAGVAQAAARALGRIGTPAAAKAIDAALNSTAPANRLAFCEGLFRCAEAMLAAGQREGAIAIYDRLLSLEGAPHQVRSGALGGAILARGEQGLPLLKQSLASADYPTFAAAVRVAMEMKMPEVGGMLVAALTGASADRQIMIIQALGARRDAAAVPALLPLTKSGDLGVRLAAVRALAPINSAAALPALVGLMNDPEKTIAQAATESLSAMTGQEVDMAITAMLQAADPQQKLTGIELASRRRMPGAMAMMMKLAGDADAKVRSAAVSKLADLAAASDFQPLVEMFMKAGDGADMDALEQAVAAAAVKTPKPDESAAFLAQLMPRAPAAQKASLVRILSTIGGGEALKAIRAVIADASADAALRAAAIRAMGTWKTVDAADDLLALARSAASDNEKTLALRSYLTMAARKDLPGDQRLRMCREATALVKRPEEKRLLIAAAASVQSPQAVNMIVPFLDDAAVKEEAATAIVGIAEKIINPRNPPKQAVQAMIEPLGRAAKATANADLAKRAESLQRAARSKAEGK